MRRRAPNRRKTEPARSSSVALVLADSGETRKRIKRDYQKALRQVREAREKLDLFHQHDQPEYVRWLHRTFGALLTELRAVAQKVQEAELLVFEVESEVLLFGSTYRRAYEHATKRREDPDAGLDDESSPFGSEGPGKDSHYDQDHDGPDPFSREDEEDWGRQQRRTSKPKKDATPKNVAARVKELYRSLVRMLHPDRQREMTPEKLERWHQTQEAYEKADVEQLEILLSLCEIDEQGTTEGTSAGLLQRITQRLKSSLWQLKSQIRKCRRDPAWNFTQREDRDWLEVELRGHLEAELAQLQEQHTSLQDTLDRWSRRAPSGRRRTRRRSEAEAFVFDFF